MRRTGLFPIVFSFFLIIMSCSVSIGAPDGLGAPDEPCGKPWNTPLSEVTGEIVDVYFATPPWTQKEGLHLMIKTSAGAIVAIHVFPKSCIDNNALETFQFAIGEFITVTGSEFLTEANTQRNICAAEIDERPELDLRTLQTGCLNEELCANCQGMCEETCSWSRKPDLCLVNCLKGCEAYITPCPEGNSNSLVVPTNFLLLKSL